MYIYIIRYPESLKMVVLIATPYYDENFFNMKKKPMIMCANCGGYGHLYKSCNHPVISYGVICYQLCFDEQSKTFIPKFLMVQRKDSLSYVEFIRGKYDLKNRSYIMRLFSNMTNDERTRILNNNFDTLWKNMWCKSSEEETNKNFTKEYSESSEKFEMLQKGYLLQTDEKEIIQFSISYIINNTESEYHETEWGFPKGRRNINEDDISCALREFKEESGIHLRNIRIAHDIKPLEEVFSGSNKIRYKHVYYVARYAVDPSDEANKYHCKEIKDVRWFSFNEMINKIRPYNVERRELSKRVYSVIMKRLSQTRI